MALWLLFFSPLLTGCSGTKLVESRKLVDRPAIPEAWLAPTLYPDEPPSTKQSAAAIGLERLSEALDLCNADKAAVREALAKP
jgi:hypothetical protein